MHRAAFTLCRAAAAVAVPRGSLSGGSLRGSTNSALQQLLRGPRQQYRGTSRRYNISAIATPFPAAPVRKEAAVWVRPVPCGPGLLQRRLGSLWRAYLAALAQHPLLTKACTSFVCVCIGDSLAQAIGGAPYSLVRVARLAAFSSTVGTVTGHFWHRFLESRVCPDSPRSTRAVTAKVALDQLLLSPIMTAVFFTALKLMEGRPDAILPFLAEKYCSTVLTSVAVWTPYNFASFRFIPQDLRPAAGGAAGILWNCYFSMSCLNAPAACTAAAMAAAVQAQASSE